MGEAFPTSNFLWNLVNGIYFVSSLLFQIPVQDGLEHIFDCYRSICSYYFSIILLLKNEFQVKKPKLFKLYNCHWK